MEVGFAGDELVAAVRDTVRMIQADRAGELRTREHRLPSSIKADDTRKE